MTVMNASATMSVAAPSPNPATSLKLPANAFEALLTLRMAEEELGDCISFDEMLIQNRAASEQDVVRLARAQERELRRWLYADAAERTGNLADRIKAVAAEVEEAYGHPVDVVSVGDTPMTPRQDALVQATGSTWRRCRQTGWASASPSSTGCSATAALRRSAARTRGRKST